jgi:hypothetical protein
MKTLTAAVSSGADDAGEVTSTLAASSAADRLSVVTQKARPRVDEPRWQAVVAQASCQGSKDVALDLPTKDGRSAESHSLPGR